MQNYYYTSLPLKTAASGLLDWKGKLQEAATPQAMSQ
jgi:hypothetical protein